MTFTAAQGRSQNFSQGGATSHLQLHWCDQRSVLIAALAIAFDMVRAPTRTGLLNVYFP